MSLRVVLLSAAHVHAPSYAHGLAAHPDADLTTVWDDDVARGQAFAAAHGAGFESDLDAALVGVDAAVVCAPNVQHRTLVEAAIAYGKPTLCEKPLATTVPDAEAMVQVARAAGVMLMTAFPCPYAPAFQAMVRRIRAGEIGRLRALCTTNRGGCPFGWFVEPELSGGGAMIDHTVHVADLLYRLLGEAPVRVQAMVGHGMYAQTWEDTAMLTLEYPSGVFATLDSSWSRTPVYKTWGDVMLTAVGERGTLEVDLFGAGVDVFRPGSRTHSLAGYGSDLDGAMIAEFIAAIREARDPMVTGEDGLAAVRVAAAAYASVGQLTPSPTA